MGSACQASYQSSTLQHFEIAINSPQPSDELARASLGRAISNMSIATILGYYGRRIYIILT